MLPIVKGFKMDFPACPYEARKAKIQSNTYLRPLMVDVEDEDDDMEDDD